MIHLVGLPHTPYDAVGASTCAFTGKAVRLARMLRSRGIDTTVYWGGDKADVSLLTVDEQHHWFGDWDPNELPKVQWNPQLDYWQLFHSRAITAISERIQPGDIVAGLVGSIHQQLFDAFAPTHTCIEPGVGYEGLARGTFACFESYAWMHNRYGALGIGDGRFFDTVIPNAVDPDDWNEPERSEGYALFVGRHIARKGVTLAADIANKAGLRLVTAGAGVAHTEPGRVTCTDGTVIEGDVKHVGAVTGQARRDLFSRAEVLICPTLYIGPFEGVHAEALMSGVPVVATDFGVFTETLPDAFRFRTFAEAVRCVRRAQSDRGAHWRQYATRIFGVSECANRYEQWYDRLMSLRDGRNGFYAP